jgi:hypothetical protein
LRRTVSVEGRQNGYSIDPGIGGGSIGGDVFQTADIIVSTTQPSPGSFEPGLFRRSATRLFTPGATGWRRRRNLVSMAMEICIFSPYLRQEASVRCYRHPPRKSNDSRRVRDIHGSGAPTSQGYGWVKHVRRQACSIVDSGHAGWHVASPRSGLPREHFGCLGRSLYGAVHASRLAGRASHAPPDSRSETFVRNAAAPRINRRLRMILGDRFGTINR